jgi:hypothetical protein
VIAVIQLVTKADVPIMHKGMMRLLKGFAVKYEAAFSEMEFGGIVAFIKRRVV